MNVFNKVTLQSLKKNKTRTIVTIIGIMLSAAMICAVTTFVSSMQNYALQYAVYQYGDWHGVTLDTSYQTYQDISGSDKVSKATYGQQLGYAKIDSQNEYKPYLYVIGGAAENYFDIMPVHVTDGRLPKSSDEILLPTHLAGNGGLIYKIGDTVTLELGERTLDGYSMGQNNPCYTYDNETNTEILNNEVIAVRKTRTYTVVGFYERPSFEEWTAPGFTALTVSDADISEEAQLDVYFKMNRASQVYDFMGTMGLGDMHNTNVLLYSGTSRYSSFSIMLVSLAAIVIGLIVFGSVSLIYNAFSISVSERTKQFGLLSSIGATKKQLKKMVVFEALTVSAVGIPLGVIVGITGIGVTLVIIGKKFSSFIGGSYDIPMKICVSWEAVVIATVIALITVLISAWIPSKRATRVSAVEAIRQSNDIKINGKQVKTSKLTYKLFGLPGVLASKHYKRNKKKYRTTVVSLFMSIVLFVSASAFTDYLMESVTGGMSADKFDLYYVAENGNNINEKTPDELLEILTSDEHVTNGVYAKQSNFTGVISKKYLSEKFVNESTELAANVDHEYGTDLTNAKQLEGYVYFVNDAEFKRLIREYNLDETDYYDSDNPLGIAFDRTIQFNADKQKYVTLDTLNGDACEIYVSQYKEIEGFSYGGAYEKENGKIVYIYYNNEDKNDILECSFEESHYTYTLRSGKTISDAPFYISHSAPCHIQMIYPDSMMEYIMPKEADVRKYQFCNAYLTSDNHAASYENLKNVLTENGILSENLVDHAENNEMSRNLVLIIQVFAYGFIVLISLIAAANVFNTISTNISLRRREFAMLKSVGMTQKGFNTMMNFECLLYGSKALILGLPVSAGITYLIYLAIMSGYETTYHLPWLAIGIAVFSVFAVVFATMLYSMSKIKKENPIDALKNENL